MLSTFRIAVALLAVLQVPLAAQIPKGLVGTWQLVSRFDRDSAGRSLPELSLDAAPSGYLIYDATGHMAAQVMDGGRHGSACAVTAKAEANNLSDINGYVAYFGRYDVDSAAGIVRHHVSGALPQADVGRTLKRHYVLAGDTLTITLRPGGSAHPNRIRTLVWHRVG